MPSSTSARSQLPTELAAPSTQVIASPSPAHSHTATNRRSSALCSGILPRASEKFAATVDIDVLEWFMSKAIPDAIRGQKYISLTTFRKNGAAVATPVWFGEDADRLYVMTRSDMGKTKRVRNNAQVRVAPCTIRGKVTGADFGALARILPPAEHAHARETINRKYWAARLPLIWWRTDTYLEITFV